MAEERIKLDAEQAASLIADGEEVHTFRAGGAILIGADWERAEILEILRIYTPEIGGEKCRAMNHGIAVRDEASWMFIATKPGIDWDAEEAEAIHRLELKGGAT